jgi:hypothetical protein
MKFLAEFFVFAIQRNKYRAYRFFFGAAAGSGNSGYTNTKVSLILP